MATYGAGGQTLTYGQLLGPTYGDFGGQGVPTNPQTASATGTSAASSAAGQTAPVAMRGAATASVAKER